MVRVSSLFGQLLREVPREEFVGLVQKRKEMGSVVVRREDRHDGEG